MKSTRGRLEVLKARLAAREAMPVLNYGQNAEAIKEEIARLEAVLGAP